MGENEFFARVQFLEFAQGAVINFFSRFGPRQKLIFRTTKEIYSWRLFFRITPLMEAVINFFRTATGRAAVINFAFRSQVRKFNFRSFPRFGHFPDDRD